MAIKSLNSLGLSPTERQVFMCLRNRPGATRVSMARDLGLSKPTVTRAITKLTSFGLVTESRTKPEAGQLGQPEIAIELDADAFRFLGLSISDYGINAAMIALNGQIIWQSEILPLRTDESGIIAQVTALTATAMQSVEVDYCDIGIVVPALFSGRDDIYEVTPTHKNIPYKEIVEALRKIYDQANVVASSRAGVLHHAIQEEHAGHVLFYLNLAEGIGGQIFDRDRPFVGGYNMAGNIGALIPETGPRPSLPDLANYLDQPRHALTLSYLDRMLMAEDARLLRWIEERADGLSYALSAVVQLINPDRLILGGDLPSSVLHQFKERIDLTRYDTQGRRPLRKPDVIVSDLLGETNRSIAAAAVPLADFAFHKNI